MIRCLSHRTNVGLLFVIAFLAVMGLFVWNRYPFGVKHYKTIVLGMQTAEVAGDSTGWAPPYNRVSEESDFFVYSLGDETMCIGANCGVGGYFIECLDGWISGYKDIGDVSDYGLREAGIDINKQRVITVADKNGKIVGIYPNAHIRNLPYIMRNHRDLVSAEKFQLCSNMLPGRR